MSENSSQTIITLGEIMLRLKSPNHERLLQNTMLEATFGGSESNVAISVANFGLPARFITAVPKNPVGQNVISFIRSFGIDTSYIIQKGSRLGIYYVEAGSGPRASVVIYDRANSSINDFAPEDLDWERAYKDGQWLHISGITPALSQNAADLTEIAMKTAHDQELMVSCDLNYRKKLWNYGKTAPEVMNPLMKYVDIIIANEEDIQNSLGITLDQAIGGVELDREKYEKMCQIVVNKYPHLKYIAISLRESFSADHNDWAAMLYDVKAKKAHFSQKYQLYDIVDRVGGGDSFAGGLIYALASNQIPSEALEFAVGASALKHTIPGDVNRVSKEEVFSLIKGNASGRVQR